jgi:hypothetical protein
MDIKGRGIMVIYQVANKTTMLFFESKKDAERFVGKYPATSGLSVYEIHVIEDSTKVTPDTEEEGKPLEMQCSEDGVAITISGDITIL